MTALTNEQIRKILVKYRLHLAKEFLVKKKEDAVKAAEKLGYPVVLKGISRDIVHKTEFGAVEVNLKYKNEVEDAFDRIVKNLQKHKKPLQGVLVQEMGQGYEVIIGGKVDPQFGPTLMFGLGGVWVEALKDVSFGVCPLTEKDALRMVEEIKGFQILKGFRGKPKGDIKALVETLLKCSNMMVKEKIQEFDINPLFVQSNGVLAVDFRISR